MQTIKVNGKEYELKKRTIYMAELVDKANESGKEAETCRIFYNYLTCAYAQKDLKELVGESIDDVDTVSVAKLFVATENAYAEDVEKAQYKQSVDSVQLAEELASRVEGAVNKVKNLK